MTDQATRRETWPGAPFPLGATWDGEGTNFSLFSEHADHVELLQDAAPGDIRERAKRGVEAGLAILNHIVQYICRDR